MLVIYHELIIIKASVFRALNGYVNIGTILLLVRHRVDTTDALLALPTNLICK